MSSRPSIKQSLSLWQEALMKQQIKEHETQVKVIERMQEIAVQEQEIQRKEKSLESKVRAPAEAEKYRLEKIAEADKVRIHLYLIFIHETNTL